MSESTTLIEKKPEEVLPGFTKLSKQILVKSPSTSSQSSPTDPTTIIIYGWGDARPKHIAKYVSGFETLFPAAKIVLIFSPILKALYQVLETRAKTMHPVLEAVFGSTSVEALTSPSAKKERILVQVMSNTGGINFAATLYAYRQIVGPGHPPFPHQMLVCDSTPGSTHFMTNIGPWSKALAVGAATYLPWPFVITRALAVVFLATMHGLAVLIGEQSAAEFSTGAVNDPSLCDVGAKRLYLYSKEDDIIFWYDIEEHAAMARGKGYDVAGEVFEGTGHVGHLRAHPEQYWAAIKGRWEEAVGNTNREVVE
ncbi:hypothetical protein B0H66DRAFT_547183 [Apodospora peruviana]|uniref:DUF829-domain-containing protein n=1 Tax=Apodospora peruviana TaxID=516989 RepID=A0AAE0MAY1_9PEZI|nr:hypothetical protein B0H66DRAFT_547183 [Apodospora peruviana]